MSPPPVAEPSLPSLPFEDVAAAASTLAPGERLVLVGADRRAIAEALRSGPSRPALLLPAADARGAGPLIRHLLDDLAALALDRWPDWPAAADSHARAAARLAAGGRAPRLPRAGPALEFEGLCRIVDPALALVVEVDPAEPRRARAAIEAIEWCQARGAPVLALLPHRPAPAPPYDRLLYGARALLAPPEPAADRLIAPPGRPHPASATERRVKAALDADPELAPLFLCNRVVTDAGLLRPRVDLLWAEGRVVVEIDGPEHQAPPKFADDRHRDYELLVAGYHVLRITNAQAATDLARAVEKIRAVVRFSRGTRTTA